MKHFIAILMLMLAAGCAQKVPPNLTPEATAAWQALPAINALVIVQDSAIALNNVKRCDPECRPLLSDNNTRLVVTVVIRAVGLIRFAPAQWKTQGLLALTVIAEGLDKDGKNTFGSYLDASRSVIKSL